MVKMRYVGIIEPAGAFNELRPLRAKLRAMQGSVRPFGPDYLILDAVLKALDTAAYHFTRESNFYAMKPPQSDYGDRKGRSSYPEDLG